MAENILRKLVNNSQIAIDDGTYDVECNLQKSTKDFLQIINYKVGDTLIVTTAQIGGAGTQDLIITLQSDDFITLSNPFNISYRANEDKFRIRSNLFFRIINGINDVFGFSSSPNENPCTSDFSLNSLITSSMKFFTSLYSASFFLKYAYIRNCISSTIAFIHIIE